jgi:hypothetical protein
VPEKSAFEGKKTKKRTRKKMKKRRMMPKVRWGAEWPLVRTKSKVTV